MITKVNKQNIYNIFIVYGVLLVCIYILESDHILRASVKDDFGFMEYFCNTGVWKSIFSVGYKFRPVSNLVMWLFVLISGGNNYFYGYLNIIYGAFAAFLVYKFIEKELKSYYLAWIAAGIYIVSRFSYYQITTQLGVMETTSTIFGIGFIWLLYKYMEKEKTKYFYYSVFLYFLCSMSHERYTVLMPVLLFVWFVTEKKEEKNWIVYLKKPIVVLGTFFIIMSLFGLLVNNVMTGTGGTDVTETISLSSFILHLFESMAYLFSINSPATYLSMIGWEEYIWEIKFVVAISILTIILIIIVNIFEIVRMEKENRKKYLFRCIMFILCIGATVFISSVTIRVELRWMYFPYIGLVFLLMHMCSVSSKKRVLFLKRFLIGVYFVTTFLFNLYCRNYYSRLYYWTDYEIANALSDSTYGEYGDEMFDKEWVIISSVEITNPYDLLMEQFDPYDKYELDVELVKNVQELQQIKDVTSKEILYFDIDKYSFINITSLLNESYM